MYCSTFLSGLFLVRLVQSFLTCPKTPHLKQRSVTSGMTQYVITTLGELTDIVILTPWFWTARTFMGTVTMSNWVVGWYSEDCLLVKGCWCLKEDWSNHLVWAVQDAEWCSSLCRLVSLLIFWTFVFSSAGVTTASKRRRTCSLPFLWCFLQPSARHEAANVPLNYPSGRATPGGDDAWLEVCRYLVFIRLNDSNNR